MSAASGLSEARAALSGNLAFQLDIETGERVFQEETMSLSANSVDVMVTHGPPCDALHGLRGKTFPTCINNLVERVRPQLFVCGHSHNPDDLQPSRKVAKLADGVLGVHVACTGVWNQLYGMPFVVDLPASKFARVADLPERSRSELLCAEGCRQGCTVS